MTAINKVRNVQINYRSTGSAVLERPSGIDETSSSTNTSQPFAIRSVECRSTSIGEGDDNTITGAAAVIGNLDSYRTVIFPNFFSDGILEDAVRNGFMADHHDWRKRIGTIQSLKVEGRELRSVGEFHGTPYAQEIRQIARERQERGKTNGESIGFGIAQQKEFKNGQELLDFAKRAGHDINAYFDVENLRADTKPMIGLLVCDRLYEFSPVSVAANDEAQADNDGVRSNQLLHGVSLQSLQTAEVRRVPANPDPLAVALPLQVSQGRADRILPIETREDGTPDYLGDDVEESVTMAAIDKILCRLWHRCIYYAICGYWDWDPMAEEYNVIVPPLDEAVTMIRGGFQQACELTVTIMTAILTRASGAETVEEAILSARALYGDPQTKSFNSGVRAARSFEDELTNALAAAGSCMQRAEKLHQVRMEDSRVLSTGRVEQIALLSETFNKFLVKYGEDVKEIKKRRLNADPETQKILTTARGQAAKLQLLALLDDFVNI